MPVSYFETIGKTERQSAESSTFSVPQQPPSQSRQQQQQAGLQRRSSATPTGNHSSTHVNEVASSSASITRGTVSAPVPQRTGTAGSSSGSGRGKMVYGTVLYDFQAERDDALSASQGESIIIIAQSTAEWFVAKPIGRLGGPGLIPITFIEIRDMTSGQVVQDPAEAIRRAGVPSVVDWKRMAAEYKAGSISLGKFEVPNGGGAPGQPGQGMGGLPQGMERLSLKNGQHYGNGNMVSDFLLAATCDGGDGRLKVVGAEQNRGSHGPEHTQWNQPQRRPLRTPLSASVPRYCFEDDKYRFIIECAMDDGSSWELSRYYQDFYDLQIALLRKFPEQQEPERPEERVLPYMPGPVTYVTDDISNKRRVFLDEYVKRLLALAPKFSRDGLVKELFEPREGDFELDPQALQEDYRLSQQSERSYPGPASSSVSRQTSQSQMNNSFAQQPQRYGAGGPQQYPGPGPQYSNRNPPQAYHGAPYPPPQQQVYSELPGGYAPEGGGGSFYHEAEAPRVVDWVPRLPKHKFFFQDELKKARVESFTVASVKRAILANSASYNRDGRAVELFQAKNEGPNVVVSDEDLRKVFRDEGRPLISVALV